MINTIPSVPDSKFLNYCLTVGLCVMEGRGFYYPVDTDMGLDGRLYTVSRSIEDDNRGIRVTMFNLDSEYFGTFGYYGEEDGHLISPTGIAVDSKNRIYVSDEYLQRITVFDSDGRFIKKWGDVGSDPGKLNGPAALTFDVDDNLYVSDHHNNRIQKFTKDGAYLSHFGCYGSLEGQLDLPWGLSIGPDGDIYVADWGNDRIQRFSPEGTLQNVYGGPGGGNGEFRKPASVAVDESGYMYIADWGNQRLQVLDPEGRFVVKLRGQATNSKWAEEYLTANGEEAEAREDSDLEPDLEFFVDDPHEESSHIEKFFWAPASVKLDSAGRVYVTESNRHRIQIYQRT